MPERCPMDGGFIPVPRYRSQIKAIVHFTLAPVCHAPIPYPQQQVLGGTAEGKELFAQGRARLSRDGRQRAQNPVNS